MKPSPGNAEPQLGKNAPHAKLGLGAPGLPPGYKLTEVGVIPVEWGCTSVRGIASAARNAIVGGPFGSDLVSANYVDDGIPVIRGTNMNSQWVSGAFVFVTPRKAKALEANLARPGDIVFTQRGTLGQVSIVPDSPFASYLVSQSQMKLSVKREAADPLFFYYVFTSDDQQDLIRGGTIQTGVPHINLGILRDIPVQLPTLPEQRAIATALSDMDALLGALDRLIAKHRDIKQAAMQQLLTGHTRLPGFKGEWLVKRLGDVGMFLKGSGVKKDESQSGSHPCIRYGEIYTRHNDYIKEFHSFISSKVAATAFLLKKGDLLFAGSGETKEEIGKCVAFVDDWEAYAGGDIVILRPQGVDSLYLGLALNTPSINRQKASRGQGDAVVHIGSSALAHITLNLPPLPEQTAIAEVLSDMDTELAALEQRRDKTRALKQGMMQELLTGRTRLV